jgi:CRP/FNR family transcriptional regulator, cyclic AMP receptor protein
MKKISKPDLVKLLPKISFFKSFTDAEIDRIAEVETFIINRPAGKPFLREGQKEEALYVLIKGLVYVNKSANPNGKLATLRPGSVFGDISFVSELKRTTNVFAEIPSIALKLNPELISHLGPEIETKIKSQFLNILFSRLEHLNKTFFKKLKV